MMETGRAVQDLDECGATSRSTSLRQADKQLDDKQIAAMAIINDLTELTRNTVYYAATGVRLLNPFAGS